MTPAQKETVLEAKPCALLIDFFFEKLTVTANVC
jgi:hypothetical protein